MASYSWLEENRVHVTQQFPDTHRISLSFAWEGIILKSKAMTDLTQKTELAVQNTVTVTTEANKFNAPDKLAEFCQLAKNSIEMDMSDFGQKPILYARVTKGSAVGVGGLISSLILASAFSPLAGLASVLILANDLKYLFNLGKAENSKPIPAPLEAESTASKVSNTEDDTYNTDNTDTNADNTDTNADNADIEDLPVCVTLTKQEGEYGTDLGLLAKMLDGIFFEIPTHIALSAVTRCGKTLTLRAIIFGLLQAPDERLNKLHIVDFKRSSWMGLEDVGAVSYLCKNGKITVDPLLNEIDRAYQVMCHRIENGKRDEPRHWLIIDEWYRTLPKIKSHDCGKEAMEKINDIAQAGLEFGVHLLLVVQNHQCEAFGFDSQARFAFRFAAIGRHGDYRTIESILGDRYMIPSKALRNKGVESISELLRNMKDPNRPIVMLATTVESEQVPDFTWLENYTIPDELLKGYKAKTNSSPTHSSTTFNLPTIQIESQEDAEELIQDCNNKIPVLTTLPEEPHLLSLYQYLGKKGQLTSRDIQQAKVSNCTGFKSQDIELCMEILEARDLINIVTVDSVQFYEIKS